MKRTGRTKEQAKLDQAIRMLFRLSKPLTVQLINGLFEETFSLDEIKAIHYGNAEFVNDAYERLVGDLFLQLETDKGLFHYHVEFQTLNDQSMVIRMFRYGFEKALELMGSGGGSEAADHEVPVLDFPRQVVIFLEENDAIEDRLALRLRLPNGEETVYEVPVIRYWKLSARDLQEMRLYALLPLQVFRSRKKLRLIALSSLSDEEKRKSTALEFEGLKASVAQTMAVLHELVVQEQLPLRAMDRMLRVIDSILTYLYEKNFYRSPSRMSDRVSEVVFIANKNLFIRLVSENL